MFYTFIDVINICPFFKPNVIIIIKSNPSTSGFSIKVHNQVSKHIGWDLAFVNQVLVMLMMSNINVSDIMCKASNV